MFRLFVLAVLFTAMSVPYSKADNYEKVIERLSEISRSEAVVGRLNWIPSYKIDEKTSKIGNKYCDPKEIRELTNSVVRIHTPIFPECDIGGTEAERLQQPLDFNGCTGWRFSKTLFATAWHCMSEGNFSCENTKVGFGYYPDLAELQTDDAVDSIKWHKTATESCSEIVYENRTLDVVIFRVTQIQHAKWLNEKPLKILPGTKSFPQEDDKILLLHYPAPEHPGCNLSIAQRLDIYDVYQMEQQISIWGRKDPYCRLIKRNDTGSIRWYSGRNPYPQDACSFDDKSGIVGSSGPINSIAYGCDTCPMSSGAPIISLSGQNNRGCTVIGMHTNSGNGEQHSTINNVGLRMSVLGECIDFEKSQKEDKIYLNSQEKTSKRPECRATVPQNVNFLDCSVDGVRLHGKVCEGYVKRPL